MYLIYLAGPFRALTSWGIEQNVRRAEEVALRLWKLGYAVICPHTLTRFYQNEAPDQLWTNGVMAMLRRCDAVFVLPDSELSIGTQEEIKEANRLDIPTFYDMTSLVEQIPA